MATEVDDYGIIGDGPLKVLWERDGPTIKFWFAKCARDRGDEPWPPK